MLVFVSTLLIKQSDELTSLEMYEHFMNTKYLYTCLKSYGTNLQLRQVAVNSQGHIRTGHQHYHMWESNPHGGDSPWFDAKTANPIGH